MVETLGDLSETSGSSAALAQVADECRRNRLLHNYGYAGEFVAEFYTSEYCAKDPRAAYYRTVQPGAHYLGYGLCDVGRRQAPHMEQACSLGYVIGQGVATQAILLQAPACKAEGVILLGNTGRPTFMNDAARAILAAADGLAYSDGVFVTRRGPESRRLQQMIGDSVAGLDSPEMRLGAQMLVSRPSGLRGYLVRVLPAQPTELFLAGLSTACVIHLQDLAIERLPSRASLSVLFGLSEREADLAIELVRATSLAHAADRAGMALNTARNHLQSIFRKSGVSSQAEAVQLFSRLP